MSTFALRRSALLAVLAAASLVGASLGGPTVERTNLAATPANPLAPVLVSVAKAPYSSTGRVSSVDISRDGRVVAFLSEDVAGTSVWIRDAAGNLIRADRGPSRNASAEAVDLTISGDGKLVLFTSTSPDLVAGFDPNGVPQLFRYDRHYGTIDAPLRATDGGPLNGEVRSPASSFDGTHVAFVTRATNIGAGDLSHRQVFLFSRLYSTPSKVRLVSANTSGKPAAGHSRNPSVGRSSGGLVVSYESSAPDVVAGDLNASSDVLFWTEASGKSALVSKAVSSDPYQDQASATSSSSGSVGRQAISADGRYISFVSAAPYAAADTNETYDAYVYDRINGTYRWASTTSGNRNSFLGAARAAMAGDGRHVAIIGVEDLMLGARAAEVTNLLVRHFDSGTLARAARATTGGPVRVDGQSYFVDSFAISYDGRTTVFATDAPLVPSDQDTTADVYVTTSSPGGVWVPANTAITLRPGTTQTVRISGAGFTGLTSGQLRKPWEFAGPEEGRDGWDPYVEKVVFVSSTALDVTITVPSSAFTHAGSNKHSLSFQRADGVVGGCLDCITIR